MHETFLEIKKLIDRSSRILLVSHIEPDGDALGSLLALKKAMENLGLVADVFCASKIPDNLKSLPGAREIKNTINALYDLVIGVDYGEIRRLETVVSRLAVPLPAITFDHHPTQDQSGEFKVIKSEFSSAAEIIYYFLAANNLVIDKDIASCLLVGIYTDTWGFRHPNANAKTLKVTGELILKGVSLTKIARLSGVNNVVNKSKIWSRALAKMVIDNECNFVFCFLSWQDIKECEASFDDLSGLASTLCMIPRMKFSLVLKEIVPGQIDGSFRSMPEAGIDVSVLAQALGGGGHKLSAGFRSTLRPEEIIGRVKQLISRQ